jgi:predicted Rossmann fold nucleotide-binding protein DprA/Smf involved in DNA uptake
VSVKNSSALTAWYALRSTPGLGAKRLVRVAMELRDQGRSADSLLGASSAELQSVGVPQRFALDAASLLSSPPDIPDAGADVGVLCPDDDEYPSDRLSDQLPLPVLLWTAGKVSLLRAPGIGISGSRSAPPSVLELATELGRIGSDAGMNIVSGGAAGVDRAAHASALQSGTTTVVLAEGLRRQLADERGDSSVLVVSGFEPLAVWTGPRAMERNSHIASLSDAVVIVAAGLAGGSWAQGQLCLRAGKTLFVVELPAEIAPGNARLARQGAIPIAPDHLESVIDRMGRSSGEPTQLRFGA